MASRTYPERVIVLRKTRLREADLVLTMLAEDGRQVRAVAKGALKPSGSFASRLELYSCADVLLVAGRSLDIVKEARLVDAHAALRFDYDRGVCAAPMAELLAHATQDELPVARLFPMTQAALSAAETAQGNALPLTMAAYLLKASSLLGFRPSLDQCAECGGQVGSDAEPTWFSHTAGGVLCADCAARQDSVVLPGATIAWAAALIGSTFARIGAMDIPDATLRTLLQFTQSWVETHICHLKSLPFAMQGL